MTDDFRQVRRSVITTFSNVLRTSALKDQGISQQQLALLLDRLMTEAGAAGPLDLSDVYEYLREQNIDDEACLEALLAFKDREEQLGYGVQLPAAIEHLPKDKRQRLLMRYQKRQRGARTRVPAAPTEADARPTQVRSAGEGPRGAGPRPGFIVATLIAALIGGGTIYYRQQTAPPAQVDVVIDASSALECEALTGSGGNMVCRMTSAQRATMTDDAFQEAGEATMTAGQGLGYTRLLVMELGSGKVLGAF